MRAGEWLRRAREDLPIASVPATMLGDASSLLVLAPHPDDESLGCGALIAACAAEGRPVHVVVVSDGRFSHPGSLKFPADRLAALRAEELRSAVAALGLDGGRDVTFLGLQDCAVPGGGQALDDACAAIQRAHPTAPGAVLSPWRHDPHRDHQATAGIADALSGGWPDTRFLSYVVWGWVFVEPVPGFAPGDEPSPSGNPSGWRFEATPWLAAKRRAIEAHRSQTTALIDDDPGGFRLTPEALALHLQTVELYLR